MRTDSVFQSVIVLALLLTGCTDRPASRTDTPSAEVPDNTSSSVASQSTPVPSNHPAVTVIQNTLTGLRQHRAKALWEFLPPSFQQDVQRLARDVATRVDQASWHELVTTWKRAETILPAKIALLKSPDRSTDSRSVQETSTTLNGPLRMLRAIGASELANLERWRSINVEQFLDKTGSELLLALSEWPSPDAAAKAPLQSLADVEVQLVSESSESATVRVQWPGQPFTEHVFVCVEDRWIPKSLADGWKDNLKVIQEQAVGFAESSRTNRDSWQASLRAVNRALDGLEAARTADDVRTAWTAAIKELPLELLPAPAEPKSPAEVPRDSPAKSKVKKADTEELLPDEK